jgi:hypothetical protein
MVTGDIGGCGERGFAYPLMCLGPLMEVVDGVGEVEGLAVVSLRAGPLACCVVSATEIVEDLALGADVPDLTVEPQGSFMVGHGKVKLAVRR